MRHGLDLTGMRSGLLIVVEKAPFDGYRTRWHCRCACGCFVVVRGERLRNGAAKSCGCIRKGAGRKFKTKTTAGTHSSAIASLTRRRTLDEAWQEVLQTWPEKMKESLAIGLRQLKREQEKAA